MRATVTVEGTEAEIEALIQAIAGRTPDVHVQIGLHVGMALAGMDEQPPVVQLRPVEREIVQMDLRGEPRREIASRLQLTPGTVTVYRRLIRLRLRAIPEDRRELWMLMWLRRFPGAAPAKPPAQPPAEEPPDT